MRYDAFARALTVSPDSAEFLRFAFAGLDVRVVPNAIDPEVFHPARFAARPRPGADAAQAAGRGRPAPAAARHAAGRLGGRDDRRRLGGARSPRRCAARRSSSRSAIRRASACRPPRRWRRAATSSASRPSAAARSSTRRSRPRSRTATCSAMARATVEAMAAYERDPEALRRDGGARHRARARDVPARAPAHRAVVVVRGAGLMRVLVALHHLELGGSQLNAVDLAARGPRPRSSRRGLRHLCRRAGTGRRPRARPRAAADARAPSAGADRERGRRVGRASARAMARASRKGDIDVVHAYEYSMILDALCGPALRQGTRLIGTVYAMKVPTWLPRSAHIIAGTPDLVAGAQAVGQSASLIVPPVDTAGDAPGAADGAAFRAAHRITDGQLALVIVSRLEPDMKRDGVARAIAAVRELDDQRLRLVVVGDGPSFAELRSRQPRSTATLGPRGGDDGRRARRPATRLCGRRRRAGHGRFGAAGDGVRQAADRPGHRRLLARCDETSIAGFLDEGFYGIGDGSPAPLGEQIAALLDAEQRRRLGAWSRSVIEQQFALTRRPTRSKASTSRRRRGPRTGRWAACAHRRAPPGGRSRRRPGPGARAAAGPRRARPQRGLKPAEPAPPALSPIFHPLRARVCATERDSPGRCLGIWRSRGLSSWPGARAATRRRGLPRPRARAHLFPVANEPILSHNLRALRAAGVLEAAILDGRRRALRDRGARSATGATGA